MRLLLDTHTFVWFIEGSLNLTDVARNLIEDQANQKFLSVASLWEMSIELLNRAIYHRLMECLIATLHFELFENIIHRNWIVLSLIMRCSAMSRSQCSCVSAIAYIGVGWE